MRSRVTVIRGVCAQTAQRQRTRRMQYLRTMALLGTAFLASRVLYFVGYSQRAKNRMVGSLVGEAVLVGMCGVCVKAGLAPLRATLGM